MNNEVREIKFRGQVIDDVVINSKIFKKNEWVCGNGFFYNKDFEKKNCGYLIPDLNTMEWIPVKKETVGQYIGLKDKNDKMIFEGDIIKKSGKIAHTIWWNKTKRSSGTPETYELNGYGIYTFTCNFIEDIKYKLIKCDYDEYHRNNSLFYGKVLRPQAFQIKNSEIEIIGNIYDNPELIK